MDERIRYFVAERRATREERAGRTMHPVDDEIGPDNDRRWFMFSEQLSRADRETELFQFVDEMVLQTLSAWEDYKSRHR